MNKVISWFIIMFIVLVPLGAFFDIKQLPKPNIQQSFMKRDKRAVNSYLGRSEFSVSERKCGNSCELEFPEILKSCFSIASTGNYLRIESVRKQLPSDVVSTGGPFVAYLVNNDIVSNVRNFYKENGIQSDEYKGDTYIDKIINVKMIFSKIKSLYYITSFLAEMPPLPEKDNEQALPIIITKNDGEYQYNQFQDKLDYLMVQRSRLVLLGIALKK